MWSAMYSGGQGREKEKHGLGCSIGHLLGLSYLSKVFLFSSIQDGSIGRNPSLPPTTKRRKTTNLKSINNQKCKKIKLHGTLTTKELKKKSARTTRPIRGRAERADSEKQQTGG